MAGWRGGGRGRGAGEKCGRDGAENKMLRVKAGDEIGKRGEELLCLLLWSDNDAHEMSLHRTASQTASLLSVYHSVLYPSFSQLFCSFLLLSSLPSNKVLHCFALGLFYVGVRLDRCSVVSLDCQTTAL